jgi:hypothetical protein
MVAKAILEFSLPLVIRRARRVGGKSMCLSCGCGEPNENHGDHRNITLDQLEESAKAADISTEQAAQNIIEGLQSSASGGSQQR